MRDHRVKVFGSFVSVNRNGLEEILDNIKRLLKKIGGKQGEKIPSTYVYRVICPSCHKTFCDLIDSNRFRCENENCQCTFSFPDPRLETESKTNKTKESVGDVMIVISSPTQDWSGVRQGETLSNVWERWSQESDVWYAVKPKDFVFSPQAQTAEAKNVLLVLSNVRNYKVFQQESLSRLAVERVLEENKENAVVEQIARLSSDDIATFTVDLRQP